LSAAKQETTQLLLDLADGTAEAADKLFTILYDDLRVRADLVLRRESRGHTLQPTALVHEAFIRMVDQRRARFSNRAHFCAIAAQAMRRILVDHARRKHAQRRGLGWRRVPLLFGANQVAVDRPEDVLLVEELIQSLAGVDPRQARIVEMRFFGGLSMEEIAAALDTPLRTVEAEWTMIRAELRAMLGKRANK